VASGVVMVDGVNFHCMVHNSFESTTVSSMNVCRVLEMDRRNIIVTLQLLYKGFQSEE